MNIFYFILGLFIGFLIVYITKEPIVITKLPKPNKDLYLDDSGVCYKYDKVKIDCPCKK